MEMEFNIVEYWTGLICIRTFATSSGFSRALVMAIPIDPDAISSKIRRLSTVMEKI
jgi:hypothetical protein